MDEPLLLVDDSAIAAALLLQVIHDLSLKLGALRVSLHRTDNLDSVNLLWLILLVVHEGALERSAERAIAQMTHNLVSVRVFLST